MLSLVNYGGSSGSEDEISDEEEIVGNRVETNSIQKPTINLPKPTTTRAATVIEEDDEFLHKKEIPSVAPPKREKIKITIPRLVKEIDDDENVKKVKNFPANKKAGLLHMLPIPSYSFAPVPKPSYSVSKPSEKNVPSSGENESSRNDFESGQGMSEDYQMQQNIDEDAMKALLGGNKAKRSKLDDIQIIDLSASEVLPNRDEWLRKTLAGETSYMPTGKIQEKGPSVLAKRKHQISYLSMRAETNEAELEAMWAANRQTKRESKSKYGF
ncbi:CLUMA_CG001030, isoform A [Clunio marinus]|uniref:CLUMA_CG001030, isoform A n=1 Tax=Clunio marinus TaxID=568069 RepID=A0A1J1HI50_9DIPT|nr:CLUMA_CG001030, isoform A [Clunio marinus]